MTVRLRVDAGLSTKEHLAALRAFVAEASRLRIELAGITDPIGLHAVALVNTSTVAKAAALLRGLASILPALTQCDVEPVRDLARDADGFQRDGLCVWCEHIAGKLVTGQGVDVPRVWRTSGFGRYGHLAIDSTVVRSRRTALAQHTLSKGTVGTTGERRQCAVCSTPITAMRADAAVCSARCRQRRKRSHPTGAAVSASPSVTATAEHGGTR